jgi:catechol 2,3-dioxygenase-like lactoylglutathione lyase family enzyme
MPIDHVGLGVPDVAAATTYYDEFMPLVGFVREWETGYRATDWYGVYEWAKARGHEIVHEPMLFPEYNAHFYATFFLDMHGFMLEAVTYEKVEDAAT